MPIVSDWIQVRTELARDPKVTRILDAVRKNLGAYVLRLSPDDLLSGVTSRVTVPVTDLVTSAALRDIVLSTLIRVWGTANHFVREETIPGVGVEWVDEVAQITGFGRAMHKVGWLEPTEAGLRFPNFNEWNRPKTNALRSNGAIRKERQRLRHWLNCHDASHEDWHAKKARLCTIESRMEERDIGRDRDVTGTPLRKGEDSIEQPPQQPLPPSHRRDRGCTLAEAQTFAATHNILPMDGNQITPEIITAWHDDRSRIGWIQVRGDAEIPIRDWQADLRAYARHWTQNSRSQALTASSRQHRNHTPPPPPIKLTTEAKKGF